MFGRVKSVLKLMGRGLASQDLDESLLGERELRRIEQRQRSFHLSGGQSRVVLIAGTKALGPAFDFAIELAADRNSMIEILYVDSSEDKAGATRQLIDRLTGLGCDFQITFLEGNLLEKLTDYNMKRQDVMAVVCSSEEAFVSQLRTGAEAFDTSLKLGGPSVVLIGGLLLA